MLSIAMMALFATLSLQLDVGDAGCVDCAEVDSGDAANLSSTTTALTPSSHDSSTAQSRYAKSSNNDDSSFPSWIKTVLGIAVVALGLVLAGKKVIRNLFISSKQSKNYARKKASHSPNYNRDAWQAKGAHRGYAEKIR